MIRALKLSVLPILGYIVLRLLWASYRVRIDPESKERLQDLPEPTIFAYWHDQIFVSSAFLTRHLLRMRDVSVMISASRDGELVTRTIRRLGLTVVRGSSSRDGAKALRTLYRHMKKEGASPVMLPDGPTGPAFEVKPGTVVLAQLSRAPIAPLAFRCSSTWTLGTWDRMQLPKPFARIDVYCAPRLDVPRELDAEALEAQQTVLSEALRAARARFESESDSPRNMLG